jgi:hypothetical protein
MTMNQTPITDQTFQHVVSRARTKIPLAWRRLREAETTTPNCDHFCPALQKLEPIRWNASALGIFFSEKSADFLRAALATCAENTRVYLLAEDKETEAAKKFAAGLTPLLRPLLRTISRQGPTAICTANNGFAWTTTRKGKSWRLTLSAKQSASFYERFLYTFWHEASAQHHLAGTTWVPQSGSAIEAPFNIPTPADSLLFLLANDDHGLPAGDLTQLISAELPDQAKASLILTDRDSHAFAKLDTLLGTGVTIQENSHDLPPAFIDSGDHAGLIMQQVGASYRLKLSAEQTQDLKSWTKTTDGWKFLRDVPRSVEPSYLEASFQLERGQETVPGKAFPGGRWEKDLGSVKASDFADQKDGRPRKEAAELPEPPALAVEAIYTWNVKPPEADKSAGKVRAYVEWDGTFKTINGIKKQLLKEFEELRKDLDNALGAHPEFKRNELGAAVLRCNVAKEELEKLEPEQSGWKHGQAPAGYDPFKTLRTWAEYYEKTYRLPVDSKAHKKWGEDISAAETAYDLAKTKVGEISKLIQECEDALKEEVPGEKAETKPDKGAIEGRVKSLRKDLEKAQRELDQRSKEKSVPAPAPGQPGDDRLAKRTDLVAPALPLPTVGELRLTPKVEELTLCIQFEEEIEPGQKEALRLAKFYAKPIRLAKG